MESELSTGELQVLVRADYSWRGAAWLLGECLNSGSGTLKVGEDRTMVTSTPLP